jgi:Tol biopolymer transport system component
MTLIVSKLLRLPAFAFFLILLPNTFAQAWTTPVSNGKIAFASDRDGNSEIYLMNADGTGQTPLTNSPDWKTQPTWSPDGRQIAFLTQNGGSFCSIYVMNADGTNIRQVTTLSTGVYDIEHGLSWSPDGRKIAFNDSTDIFTINDIFTIEIDGTNLVNLTKGTGYDYKPAWSPDGSRIAFTRRDGLHSTIFTMNADGSNVTRITFCELCDNQGGQSSPDWSLDGGQIVFRDFRDNDYLLNGISVVNSDGTQLRRLVTGIDYCDMPKWSPDGTKIIFSNTRMFGAPPYQIWVISSQGGGLTQITVTAPNNSNPDWQPLHSMGEISGRIITAAGLGIRNALVSLTDSGDFTRTGTTSSLGYYSFDNVRLGTLYTIAVSSKRYRFATRSLQMNSDLTSFDFIGLE